MKGVVLNSPHTLLWQAKKWRGSWLGLHHLLFLNLHLLSCCLPYPAICPSTVCPPSHLPSLLLSSPLATLPAGYCPSCLPSVAALDLGQ